MHKMFTAATTVLLAFSPASSADAIRFSPGPNGSTRISTPWGQYVAVDEGDRIWVGTEAEWNGQIADQVARDQGDRRVRIVGERSGDRTYVDAAAPAVRIDSTEVAGIASSIVFGVPASKALRRPPKAPGAEYAQITWTPSDAIPTRAVLEIGGASVQPNDCGSTTGFRYCEFTVQRGQLTAPAEIFFLNPGAKPAVLPVPSIAKASYATMALTYRSGSGLAVSADDQADLKRLHLLDGSIPLKINQ